MYTNYNPFFTVTTRKLCRTNFKLFQLPHLLTFIMLALYLAKQTLMLYQCYYYVIIVFVYNLLHFNAFNHLHRLMWAE